MAAPSRSQLVNHIYELLHKRYKLEPQAGRLSVLEAVVFAICHEGTTREQANQALSRFKDQFFDWNEVRVSALIEIEDVLAGIPAHADRARRIRRFLRQLFSKTYGFTLDHQLKKPQKDVVKYLEKFDAFKSDYVLASVIQHAMGGHAIPVDDPMRRALERLGVAAASDHDPAIRASLERAVAKNRGRAFGDLIEELSHDTCVPRTPDCPRCELRKICPTAHALSAAAIAASKAAKSAATAASKAAKSAATAASKASRSAATAAAKAAAKAVAKPTAKAEASPSAPAEKPASKAKTPTPKPTKSGVKPVPPPAPAAPKSNPKAAPKGKGATAPPMPSPSKPKRSPKSR